MSNHPQQTRLKAGLAVIFLLTCVALIFAVALGNMSGPGPITPPSGYSDIQAEYGGLTDVYEGIFALTSCEELQSRFDTSEANFQRELAAGAGRETFRKMALGYMNGSLRRMQQLGCPGSAPI